MLSFVNSKPAAVVTNSKLDLFGDDDGDVGDLFGGATKAAPTPASPTKKPVNSGLFDDDDGVCTL